MYIATQNFIGLIPKHNNVCFKFSSLLLMFDKKVKIVDFEFKNFVLPINCL